MRKVLTAIGLIIISTTMMSHAQSAQSIPVADNETSQLWFVELSSPPSIDGTAVATLEREEATFTPPPRAPASAIPNAATSASCSTA